MVWGQLMFLKFQQALSDGETYYQVYSVADSAFWIYHDIETVKLPNTIYKFGSSVFF